MPGECLNGVDVHIYKLHTARRNVTAQANSCFHLTDASGRRR